MKSAANPKNWFKRWKDHRNNEEKEDGPSMNIGTPFAAMRTHLQAEYDERAKEWALVSVAIQKPDSQVNLRNRMNPATCSRSEEQKNLPCSTNTNVESPKPLRAPKPTPRSSIAAKRQPPPRPPVPRLRSQPPVQPRPRSLEQEVEAPPITPRPRKSQSADAEPSGAFTEPVTSPPPCFDQRDLTPKPVPRMRPTSLFVMGSDGAPTNDAGPTPRSRIVSIREDSMPDPRTSLLSTTASEVSNRSSIHSASSESDGTLKETSDAEVELQTSQRGANRKNLPLPSPPTREPSSPALAETLDSPVRDCGLTTSLYQKLPDIEEFLGKDLSQTPALPSKMVPDLKVEATLLKKMVLDRSSIDPSENPYLDPSREDEVGETLDQNRPACDLKDTGCIQMSTASLSENPTGAALSSPTEDAHPCLEEENEEAIYATPEVESTLTEMEESSNFDHQSGDFMPGQTQCSALTTDNAPPLPSRYPVAAPHFAPSVIPSSVSNPKTDPIIDHPARDLSSIPAPTRSLDSEPKENQTLHVQLPPNPEEESVYNEFEEDVYNEFEEDVYNEPEDDVYNKPEDDEEAVSPSTRNTHGAAERESSTASVLVEFF